MKGTISSTVLAILAGAAFPAVANAVILNGGFEDSFSSWETLGDYRIETSAFGSNPLEERSQAFLSTAFNQVVSLDENGNEIVDGNAAPVTFIFGFAEDYSLEGFLGLSTFFESESLADIAKDSDPIEGSAIRQTFTAEAGQTLSFYWNFLTNESVGQAAMEDFTYPDYNDFAFVSIQSDSSSKLLSLADTISTFSNSSTSFNSETGFRRFSYTIPTTGTYTLGIGVVDVGEPTRISGLLIDQAEIAEAVPETSSVLGLIAFGVLGTILGLRRTKQ